MAFIRPSELHSHGVAGACSTAAARLNVFQPWSFHDTIDLDQDFLLHVPPTDLSPTLQPEASSPLLPGLPLRESNQKMQCVNAAFVEGTKAWLTENSIGNLDQFVSNELEREHLGSFASSTRCCYGSQLLRKRNAGRRAAGKVVSPNTQRRLSHKESERQRRKEMNCQFTKIQALLPRPLIKNDRCTTITESINYIQSLQQQLEELRRKRRKLLECMQAQGIRAPMCSSAPPSVMETFSTSSTTSGPSAAEQHDRKLVCEANMQVYEKEIFIAMTSSKMGSILSGLMGVLNEHELELLNANVSMSDSLVFFSIHATAKEKRKQCKESLRCALELLIGTKIKVENASL